jgi:alpha/beta superfamily hydrolase
MHFPCVRYFSFFSHSVTLGAIVSVLAPAIWAVESVDRSNPIQKDSYSLGAVLGAQLAPTFIHDQVKIMPDFFAQGVLDSMAGMPLKMPLQDIKDTVKAVEKRVAARRKASLKSNKHTQAGSAAPAKQQ